MAKIKNSISTLIETQLPEFISTEYELFGNFLTKYYESLEIQGAPLDIANNLEMYADIGFYENKILEQHTELVGNLTASATSITVLDARSFPEKNGYIKIDKEICFYKRRTATEFLDVSRGVSGNTRLGDIYNETEFVSSAASTHSGGELVQNVSNLFLYAIVRNFEEQYLASFPEKYLKTAVDKRSLIKYIGQFYRSKGTEKSIQFLFNTVIAGGQENRPSVYNPSDFTYKSSTSDWTQGYALRVKVLSGNVEDLIGKQIVQEVGQRNGYASAIVDNVRFDSSVDGEDTYNLFLATETINGIFEYTSKTELTQEIFANTDIGDRINVTSTLGWSDTGSLLIGEEIFTFDDKNITQFTISGRRLNASYPAGTAVYDPIIIGNDQVKLLVFGLVYNLLPSQASPYSFANDPIEVTNPGFETNDPKIVTSQGIRWMLSNPNDKPTSPTNTSYTNSLSNLSTDVSAVFSDEQFYYIASSGYPSYPILENVTSIPGNLADQKILKLIRKQVSSTTEIYKTPNIDTGILLNGTRIYSYKDTDTVRFGKLERIAVQNQGSNYKNAPYVLVNDVPGRSVAKMAGQFVESIEVLEPGLYGKTPRVEITSGRGAQVRATVTFGRVTDLIIDNPGEYYSTPPIVIITDLSGQGRLAEYRAIVSDGKLTDFELVNEGSFYSQENVRVDIFPIGKGAVVQPQLTEWVKDRYYKLKNTLDENYGFVFENFNKSLEYGYAHVANPKSLRVRLNDNLSSLGVEPVNKIHSPILGFAYDGNPIYGPFAHQDPLDAQSPIVRMTSSYILKPSRSFGPSAKDYPLGSFIQDYEYRHKSGSLDQNNGRYCVTPDYPEGTYAYFITINSQQEPQFPYVVGENFYSLPVESNYASDLNQKNISTNVKRLFVPGMQGNGGGLNAIIQDLESGSIDSIEVVESSDSFSVGSKLFFDNEGTQGSGVEASVSSVTGKSVNYIESFEKKAVKLVITTDSYVFENDKLRQPGSGAFGTIVGTVRADNTILIKDVNGVFNSTATFSTDIKVVRLSIDKVSSYAQGSILSLTDGIVTTAAEGEVLESVISGNTVILKVLSGTFEDQEDLPGYFIKSNSLSDTSGARIDSVEYLSDGLVPFDIDSNIALVETSEEHGLAIGDTINVFINPDDSTKTRNYLVRKRIYQELQLRTPRYDTTVNYSGIGRGIILNGGDLYDVGSYTNIPLSGGSGEGATANIVVSPFTAGGVTGYISNIQISNGGTGYKRGDVLGVEDTSLNKVPGSSPQTLRFFVDHVGVSDVATKINVRSAVEYAEGDLLKIDNEIVKVISIVNNQVQGGVLTVERGQEGTKAVDHYDKAPVSLYNAGYNFDSNFSVNGSDSVIYDKENQKLLIVYPSSQSLATLQPITEQTTFFDDSTPRRFVEITTASAPENRFEFKLDPSLSIFGTSAPNEYVSEWTVNPIIEVQEYYKYRFDTSDNSLTGSHLDFSPSRNYNIIPFEKEESSILQGSPGSFVEMKFGFGPNIATNQYKDKELSRFSNYFYFDRNGLVSSGNSYLKVVQDPLTGRQIVNYVTPTRFSYSLKKFPQWDGSGDITYSTTGNFAVGEIDSVSVQNIGANYKKSPIVLGAFLNSENQATAEVLFDPLTDTIIGAKVTNTGSNYSNPKVVIIDGDGIDAEFGVTYRNGEVLDVFVINKGSDYTKAPEIAIIESDVKLFANGSRIGRPKNVRIIKNGSSFHKDKTLLSEYTGSYTFSVYGYGNSDFLNGEIITQKVGNTVVASGTVLEWRTGSNLLKVSKIRGKFREGLSLVGQISNTTATIENTYVSIFDLDLKPYSDNTGSYRSDKGKLGVENQRITDSFFYQDYSYVIKSRTQINTWRDLVKETTHPAGFKVFGEIIVDPIVEDGITMPSEMPKASHFSIIQLWDDNKNKVTVESTRQQLTQSILTVDDYRAIRGSGSVAVNEFDFNYTNAYQLTLQEPFDGQFNTDGQLVGRKTFTLSYLNQPFNAYSAENLIITLDGVLQEPLVAYTISNNQITFATPPLGEATLEGQLVPAQTVLIRYLEFKNNSYNDKHFRKIRNFYQRNGRWLDASNQILLNVDFIIAESIGWFEDTYSSEIASSTIPWTAIEGRVTADLRNLCSALEHDLRFGGNVKSVDYADLFAEKYKRQNTQINALFQYAIRLAKLAVRNWDWVAIGVSYTAGNDIITISDTSNVALGAVVSSGQAFPLSANIRVIEILSDTQVRVSSPALVDSGTAPPGSAGPGITYLNGIQIGNVTLPTGTGAVTPPNTYSIPPGSSLSSPPVFAGLDQVTFTFSGLNNGTFYDASNLIDKNRNYITDYAVNWAQATYPGIDWTSKETKCRRDIGYLLDAVIYNLRFGGNLKLVEFAELYFLGSQLNYIIGEFTETKATYEKILTELCVQAMLQTLPTSTPYTNILPVIDLEVIVDSASPACSGVESALNTYYDIIETILNTGPNVIQPTNQNPTRRGFYTRLVPYANYDIIPDNQLVSRECEDVVSSLTSFGDIFTEYMVYGSSVARTLPDYIDNETSEFELYWDDDGSPVSLTETDEHLLVAFNGVIQRPKYNPDEPAFDSYWVDRTVVPNIIKFTAPPIWDQDLSAKTIGEPTQVEKFFATNIGNYRRYTIDKSLVNGIRKGPFLILSVDGDRILNIDEENYMIVIVNGVIQKPVSAYTVAGASITFSYPMREEDIVDIRLCYGRDLEPTVTFHDFDINGFLYNQTLNIEGSNAGFKFSTFINGSDYALTTFEKLFIYQQDTNENIFPIGKAYDWKVLSNNKIVFKLHTNNTTFDPSLRTFATTMGASSVATHFLGLVGFNLTSATLTKDLDFLTRTDRSYYRPDIKKAQDLVQRKGFFRLAPGDKVKIDGESKYRTVRSVPDEVYTRDNRLYNDAGNEIYGSFGISSYNGKTMGEGLSVSAEITNGVVTALKWNERIVDEIVNSDGSITYKFYRPTAYNYETPPQLVFVPRDENGGGARAQVLVAGGEIQGIQLIYGGFGYTEAPKVVVTRKYDVKKQDDIKVSLVKLGVQSVISQGLTVISTIDVITLPPPEQAFVTSIFLDSVIDVKDDIECEIYPDPIDGANMPADTLPIKRKQIINLGPHSVEQAETSDRYVQSILAVRAEDVLTISQLTASRFVTQTLQREIDNTFLENVIYRSPGAYLQAPLNIGDTIVYVVDTTQFTSHGKLMVGDEVVYYPRKIRDRFINVTRGYENTTEKNWAPGTFIRQIEDYVSIAFGGVSTINSETIVRNSIPTGISERKTQHQYEIASQFDMLSFRQHISELQVLRDIQSVTSSKTEVILDVPAGDTRIVSDFTTFSPEKTIAVSYAQIVTDCSYESSETDIIVNIDLGSVESIITDVSAISDRFVVVSAGAENVVSDFTSFSPSGTITTSKIVIQSTVSLRTETATELLLFTPPGGILDYFQESIFFTNPIETRIGVAVVIIEQTVTQRNGNIISLRNILETEQISYIGDYSVGNVGSNISSWDAASINEGTIPSSGFTLEQFGFFFPSFTIDNFERRGYSNYTLSGEKFNLGLPTYNNPTTTTSSSGSIGSSITVQNTNYFPDSGYIFHGSGSNRGLIYYTSKTQTSFQGCTVYSGSTTIISGSEIIPYTVD